MDKEKYNGWTNYITWKVNLELLDGASYMDFSDKHITADEIQDHIWYELTDGHLDNKPHDFAHSCMISMLSDVNWHEIAEHLNED